MTVSLVKPNVLTSAHWTACSLECPLLDGHPCPADDGFTRCPGWSAKFSSAAAELLWEWSLSSFQDETCGEAQYGNGWHALFRSVSAILACNSQGFVYASRWNANDLDGVWAAAEKGAVYESDGWDDEWLDRDHECAPETCGAES